VSARVFKKTEQAATVRERSRNPSAVTATSAARGLSALFRYSAWLMLAPHGKSWLIGARTVSCITATDTRFGPYACAVQLLSPSLGWPCSPDLRPGAVGAAWGDWRPAPADCQVERSRSVFSSITLFDRSPTSDDQTRAWRSPASFCGRQAVQAVWGEGERPTGAPTAPCREFRASRSIQQQQRCCRQSLTHRFCLLKAKNRCNEGLSCLRDTPRATIADL